MPADEPRPRVRYRPRVVAEECLESRELLAAAVELTPQVAGVRATRDVTPPTVVATHLDRTGLALTFSEPMNSSRASDRRNYVIREVAVEKSGVLGWYTNPFGDHSKTKIEVVPIRSATYDPATRTVRLRPARALSSTAQYIVSNASLASRPGVVASRSLLDTTGNPLETPAPSNRPLISRPAGSFRFIVPRGYTTPPKT